MKFMFAGVTLA